MLPLSGFDIDHSKYRPDINVVSTKNTFRHSFVMISELIRSLVPPYRDRRKKYIAGMTERQAMRWHLYRYLNVFSESNMVSSTKRNISLRNCSSKLNDVYHTNACSTLSSHSISWTVPLLRSVTISTFNQQLVPDRVVYGELRRISVMDILHAYLVHSRRHSRLIYLITPWLNS